MNSKGRGVSWSEVDALHLTRLYGSVPISQIAALLGRTCPAISQKAKALGLVQTDASVTRAHINWTQEIDQFITAQYPHTSARQIADQLGLTTFNVKHRVKKLGLKKPAANSPRNRAFNQSFTPWTTTDDQLLRKLHATIPARQIAIQLKRSVAAIHMRMHKLNLTKNGTAGRGRTIPLGGERTNSKGLLVRKISETGNQRHDYKRVDLIEWEKVNGPLPEGMILVIKNPFLPRTPDNLQPLTAKQLTARISGQDICPQLRELFQLQRQLTKALKPTSKKPSQDSASC